MPRKKKVQEPVNNLVKINEELEILPVTRQLDINTNSVEVLIYPSVTFTNRCQMIADAIDLVFANGDFSSYMQEFAIKYVMVKYFTNIDMDMSPDKVWELVCNTSIMNDIYAVVGIDFANIDYEIRNGIEWRKETIKTFAIAQSIDIISESIAEAMDKLNTVTDGIGNFVTNLAQMDVSTEKVDEIIKLAKSLSNGDEKLIKALI